MTRHPKTEDWIKEAEDHPESALVMLRLIAGRLHDLTERNEGLLAENISLQDGSQVKEYRQRIAYLEYQLELLKRRFGPEGLLIPGLPAEPAPPEIVSLLVYSARGRVIRLEANLPELTDRLSLGQILGDSFTSGEWPRLLAIPSSEELLMLFSSGRVGTCNVAQIPVLATGAAWLWEEAALPDEPHGGEQLSAIMPLVRLPLSDFILQVSRRSCVKKTMTSLAETVLSNHFIGRGTLKKADQPFESLLCHKKARLVLVTYEGRLLGLDVDDLTYSAEDRLRLEPHDHVVAAFVVEPKESLLCLTQTGKVVQRESAMLEPAKTGNTRGQALISPVRLDQGTRFIGAAAIRESDRLLVLDASGSLTLHFASALTGSGALPASGPVLAFCVVPATLSEFRK
jgi:hypothetical protein